MQREIKPITKADLDAILALDAVCFSDTVFTKDLLRSMLMMPHCVGFGLHMQKELMGYILFSVQGDASDVLSFCIHPNFQNSGHGRFLAACSLQQLRAAGVKRFVLEVRESNAAAQNLYKDLGGVEVGKRKGYYQNPPENALVYCIY